MARTSLIMACFLGMGLSRPTLADEPASIRPVSVVQVQKSVDRAIGYLQTESAAWWSTRKCAACHALFGLGGKVGPELTTYKRDDLDALIAQAAESAEPA